MSRKRLPESWQLLRGLGGSRPRTSCGISRRATVVTSTSSSEGRTRPTTSTLLCAPTTPYSVSRLLLQGGLCLAGKLGCLGVILAMRPSCLFYVMDTSSNCHFPVDTGSAFSIMPWQSAEPPSGSSLSGADGCHIPCRWSNPSVTIDAMTRLPCWASIFCIISFLYGRCGKPPATVSPCSGGCCCCLPLLHRGSEFTDGGILSTFFVTLYAFVGLLSSSSGILYTFIGLLFSFCGCLFSFCRWLLVGGHTVLVSAGLAPPLHMVRKKDGTWWSCGDYYQLNLQMIQDK
jgi:hypothetical protein